MNRGGYRKGSGRKSPWKSGDTRTIRVPEILADRLLEIAHWLDEGGNIEFVTESKVSQNENVTFSKANFENVTKPSTEVEIDGWITTREAWDYLGQPKAWNTFRKLSSEKLKDEFGLEADLNRKVQGKTDSRWLRLGQ
jgi:hypothetical protein